MRSRAGRQPRRTHPSRGPHHAAPALPPVDVVEADEAPVGMRLVRACGLRLACAAAGRAALAELPTAQVPVAQVLQQPGPHAKNGRKRDARTHVRPVVSLP